MLIFIGDGFQANGQVENFRKRSKKDEGAMRLLVGKEKKGKARGTGGKRFLCGACLALTRKQQQLSAQDQSNTPRVTFI